MPFLAELSEIITEHEPLAPLTWFELGGPARWFARPRSIPELQTLVRQCNVEGVELFRLGRGANLLVSDEGVDGVVVRLDMPAFQEIVWPTDLRSDTVLVRVGGGVDMATLARDAVNRGLAGLECMGGIPGSMGGIIRMNAGGRFGQIADVVRDVTIIDEAGNLRTLSHDEVGFSYRRTRLGDATVVGATLALQPVDPGPLRERFLEIMQYKKASQPPMGDKSAGCIFKNPPGQSAGALIDRAGLKGRSVNGAYVSEKHANFIMAREGGTARDVLTLIGIVRREVAERFGVELELEIEVWDRRRARSSEPVL